MSIWRQTCEEIEEKEKKENLKRNALVIETEWKKYIDAEHKEGIFSDSFFNSLGDLLELILERKLTLELN